MSYYDNVNGDLLAMIPPDAAKVCEVGCGAGSLARTYKQINPSCDYFGIELDFSAWRAAGDTGVFKDLLNSDGEKCYAYSYTQEEPDLDALVLGDVLEHMRDPFRFLKHATENWIGAGGQVLACIPNVQNFMLVSNLLAGSFDYADEGLLDRTHLRWFTKSSIAKAFEDAGLTVTSIEPRNWGDQFDQQHGYFLKMMAKFIADTGIDRKQFAEETRAFQWLIRGVKGDAPIRKILIRSFAANHCCARPRLTEPYKFVATVPGVRYSDSETEIRAGEAPVVIVQRDKFDIEQVRKWVHSGMLVIGEWDDDPDYFECNTKSDYLPLKAVHAMSCSTDVMADSLLKHNPNVGVFHNQIAMLPPPPEKREGPIRIFCGWQNRSRDWKEILGPLNDALKDHPETEVYVVQDREFFHALKADSKKFWTFQTYEKYIELLRQCDIALLPLERNRFNDHKSDIKLLECYANGVVPMASGDSVYAEPITQSESGILYFNSDGFRRDLCNLIDNSFMRSWNWHRACGRSYVERSRLLKDHHRDRYSWICALLDAREELTEQLLERVPELRSSSAL